MHTDNTIEAIEKDYLYIQKSQITNAGKGLFTAVDIFKEETIAVFEGEILSAKEIEQRVEAGIDQYFIAMLDGTIMDSKNSTCFARFANDANGVANSLFKNNAKITIDENNQVCLTATKKIKNNQEIFCGYGKRYWKKHNLT
jgi:SET domain-containing protein